MKTDRNRAQTEPHNLKLTQPTRPKNDVEIEERRRKRVKRADLLPSEGKKAKRHRKRSGCAEKGLDDCACFQTIK